MTDALTVFRALRRPQLLLRAARMGTLDYRRDRDLRRLLGLARAPGPLAALEALLDVEARAEEIRQTGASTYDIGRHIDILIAMIVEARLIAPRPEVR